MAKLTGLNTDTPKRLLLDCGVFLKGEYRTKATVEAAMLVPANRLGATNGGGSFNAVPDYRQAQVDGGIQNIKDLITINSWTVTMEANVKEITAQNIQLALGAATTTSATDHTVITGANDFASANYTAITWAGKLKGHTNPVIIIIKNAISLNGLNLSVADKDEATVAITLTACYDLSTLETAPFEILYPNDDSELGALTVTSVAGTTTGKTSVTVTPAKASGNSYVYKTGSAAQTVTYDQVLTSWTVWDGTSEITTSDAVITVAEVDTNTKAKKVGSADIVVA